MAKAVEVAKDDFAAIRTGRAHPSMFSNIVADYYGSPTPLQQLAGFQVPDPRTVLISPYDKGAMPAIEKAIRDSDMGVNPGNDGSVIRITMPQLTEERRKEYIKVAKTKGEDAKVSVRTIRRHAKDSIDKSVKDGEAGEDEGKSAEKRLDGMTKKYVDSIDQLLKHKEAELLEV
nr:ribosome recycling factor [Streptomyces sp. SID13031]